MEQFVRHIELQRENMADWTIYPFDIPAIASLQRLAFNPQVTFLVGENGPGKSTLIEAIAIKAGFDAERGTRNFSTAFRPSESPLHQRLRMARGVRREKRGFFLRAETMFNVPTEAEQYRDYGWEALHEKSHGEAFLWVANERFASAATDCMYWTSRKPRSRRNDNSRCLHACTNSWTGAVNSAYPRIHRY